MLSRLVVLMLGIVSLCGLYFDTSFSREGDMTLWDGHVLSKATTRLATEGRLRTILLLVF